MEQQKIHYRDREWNGWQGWLTSRPNNVGSYMGSHAVFMRVVLTLAMSSLSHRHRLTRVWCESVSPFVCLVLMNM